MRFSDLAACPGWTVHYNGYTLDREKVAAQACSLASVIEKRLSEPNKLTIFAASSPIEMLLSYFVASRLGLLAAILSRRSVEGFVQQLDPGTIGLLVWPEVAAKTPVSPEIPVVLVDWSNLDAPRGNQFAPQPGTPPARFVFSSSGSTGSPKRIVHDERRLIANAKMVADYLGLTASDRSFCVFPINYMYGLSTTLCALITGGTIEYGDFRNPSLLTLQADNCGSTVLPVIGDWATRLAAAWSGQQPPLRRIILNASDRLLKAQAAALLPHASAFWNNFGQTEAAPRLFAVQASPENLDALCEDDQVAPGYLADPQIEARIGGCDAHGYGAFSYRSPYAMLGTMSASGALQPAPEWIESGDLFRLETGGLYRWGGRVTHAVKHNGRFVPLRNIADRVLIHKAVTGVGIAKGADGELTLFVESPVAEQGLKQELHSIVSSEGNGFPVEIRVLPELPRTESGKVDARQLHRTYHGGL